MLTLVNKNAAGEIEEVNLNGVIDRIRGFCGGCILHSWSLTGGSSDLSVETKNVFAKQVTDYLLSESDIDVRGGLENEEQLTRGTVIATDAIHGEVDNPAAFTLWYVMTHDHRWCLSPVSTNWKSDNEVITGILLSEYDEERTTYFNNL